MSPNMLSTSIVCLLIVTVLCQNDDYIIFWISTQCIMPWFTFKFHFPSLQKLHSTSLEIRRRKASLVFSEHPKWVIMPVNP